MKIVIWLGEQPVYTGWVYKLQAMSSPSERVCEWIIMLDFDKGVAKLLCDQKISSTSLVMSLLWACDFPRFHWVISDLFDYDEQDNQY